MLKLPRFAWIPCWILILVLNTSTQEQYSERHWSYEGPSGPSHWGDLSPEFVTCKAGHRQSPIDLQNARRAALQPLRFDYRPSPLHIIDNAHTIMINYEPGSFMSVAGKKYALKQFHFHHPSEEKIKGKGFDMDVHLVHMDEEGRVAVVAVLLQHGDENPLIRELWNHLPTEKQKEERLDNIQVNASELLPADRSYFTFSGSLTTPPCTEGVTWFVLKDAVAVSTGQIRQFSALYRNNARQIQSLNGRTVLENQ